MGVGGVNTSEQIRDAKSIATVYHSCKRKGGGIWEAYSLPPESIMEFTRDMAARWPGRCAWCVKYCDRGEDVTYFPAYKRIVHNGCAAEMIWLIGGPWRIGTFYAERKQAEAQAKALAPKVIGMGPYHLKIGVRVCSHDHRKPAAAKACRQIQSGVAA